MWIKLSLFCWTFILEWCVWGPIRQGNCSSNLVKRAVTHCSGFAVAIVVVFVDYIYISATLLINGLLFKFFTSLWIVILFNKKNITIELITICNWWRPITELFFSLSHLDSFKVHFCVYPFYERVFLFFFVRSRWKIIFTRFLLQSLGMYMHCCNTPNLHTK